MELSSEKFVDFDKYCRDCEHEALDSTEDPCDECLSHPVNEYSHKPINFKERE